MFVLVHDGSCIPVWPNPLKIVKGSLPVFCEKEFRGSIIEKFRVHLHQHPEIPFNDEHHTRFTAAEIYEGAAKDMYEFCYEHDLLQVWAYLWNQWYTPNQWKLWAWSADKAIPRLKTTMIVESLWKHIKHRDLKDFNHPRLDLVTHIVIKTVLPRVVKRLDYVRGLQRIGRAKVLAGWQTDFCADWLDMGRSDEHRLVEKELQLLKSSAKAKGRSERLAEIAEEEIQPCGIYLTEIDRWMCSCPAYLISCFLLCKHLVREANEILDNAPRTSLVFFANLRRQHHPPFYSIEGIHFQKPMEEIVQPKIRVLGQRQREDSTEEENERATPILETVPQNAATSGEALERSSELANKKTDSAVEEPNKEVDEGDESESDDDEGNKGFADGGKKERVSAPKIRHAHTL